MTEFDVILRSIDDPATPGERFSFVLSPGDEIIFGRAPNAAIVITDPQVSGHHGKIACTASGTLVASDLGSLNGIFSEGQQLPSKQLYKIDLGCILTVGDHTLEITSPPEHETVRHHDIALARSSLANDLETLYGQGLDLSSGDRRTSMESAVQRRMEGLSQKEGAMLLQTLLAGGPTGGCNFPELSPQRPDQTVNNHSSAPYGNSEAPSSADSAQATATLRALAAELVPSKPLETDQDFETFSQLLQQLCRSTLNWLAKGLNSRGVFAEEFGAEVTLMFQRSTNPLKAMTLDDLTEYLLDWRHETPPETRSHYLEGVLKDMSEHQVGMIAGVKEAITSVLGQLAPERIEKLAEAAKGWSKSAKVWSTYQATHKELSEEQSKLFAEMITPAIQKGYLHQHGDDDKSSPPSV